MQQRRVRITAGDVEVTALLNDTRTAGLIWDALPLQTSGSTWGDEIFFETPVPSEDENLQELVEMGDLAFWPPGRALCLFFGPTPASRGDEIRPSSPVTVVGRIEGDPTVLRAVASGAAVLVAKG